MSAEPIVPASVSPPKAAPVRAMRVEYVDFQDVAEHREFRFRVHAIEGPIERRVRVAVSAFAGRVGFRTGPMSAIRSCSRPWLRADVTSMETITVDEADLARYAEAHTKAPKHRSWSATSPATPVAPREHAGTPAPARRPSPSWLFPCSRGGRRPPRGLRPRGDERADGVHTVIHFDEDGPKRFVTAILAVDVLSTPPHLGDGTPRKEPALLLSGLQASAGSALRAAPSGSFRTSDTSSRTMVLALRRRVARPGGQASAVRFPRAHELQQRAAIRRASRRGRARRRCGSA
jgi:hypothetical protein